MSMPDTLLRFDALDSLFFRDGRPYTQGESEQVGVVSQFPPTPATLVGATRAAIARALGWDGRSGWGDDIKPLLGDGEALGVLTFRGPVLLRDADPSRDADLLFPAPANLMRRESDKHTALLQPGPLRHCDLGPAVRLPALPADAQSQGWKPATGTWLAGAPFEAILQGQAPVPDDLVDQDELWRHEARVGIARNETTRTTEEGALYSPQHVRLQARTSLGLWVEGLPADALERLARTAHPLGGESRSAWISSAGHAPNPPAMPSKMYRNGETLCYSVVVLSPLPLTPALQPGQPVADLPGTLVSACLPRALMLGGWDSVAGRPLPLKPHLAPGSVLFMQAPASQEKPIRSLHLNCIGQRPAWGYGWIAIGTWNPENL